MYIWRIDRLKKELLEGPLPQAEQFKYLLAYSILFAIVTVPLPDINVHDTINGAVTLFLTPLGLYLLYYSNGGRNGVQFIEKYLSLGWVFFVRFLVMVVLPVALAAVVLRPVLHVESEGTDILDIVLTSLLEIAYYLLLSRQFRELRRNQPNQAL
jgi:hypothetical protein